MRLADVILRRGHLSEGALAEVCTTGERPVHLDRCDICSDRVLELSRWLEELRTVGVEDADAAFPPERLAAQQTQILRRLEQLDRPARVIHFPTQARYDLRAMGGNGVRPAWIGIAAAAGIMLGLLGGQVSMRLTQHALAPVRPAVQSEGVATAAYEAPPAVREFDESETVTFISLSAMDELEPHAIQASVQGTTVR